MSEEFVIMIVMLILFGSPYLYAYHSRRMRHLETLAMIEKGLVEAPKTSNGKDTLRWGIAITSIGAALTLGVWPLGFVFEGNQFPLGFGPWMLVGLLPLFFGIGLILIYHYTKEENGKPDSK